MSDSCSDYEHIAVIQYNMTQSIPVSIPIELDPLIDANSFYINQIRHIVDPRLARLN
jgi:hypothetical protein